jgi:hypothetical protein
MPGFFFLYLLQSLHQPGTISSGVSTVCNKPGLGKSLMPAIALMPINDRRAFETAIANAQPRSAVSQGYPLPTNKKNRVCVATYRHSGEQLLENSFPPHSNLAGL